MAAKKRFDGQVAWITGAGSGIGKALAIEMARRGATVVVSGRRRANLDDVVSRGRVEVDADERLPMAVVELVGRRVAIEGAHGDSIRGSIRRHRHDDELARLE